MLWPCYDEKSCIIQVDFDTAILHYDQQVAALHTSLSTTVSSIFKCSLMMTIVFCCNYLEV